MLIEALFDALIAFIIAIAVAGVLTIIAKTVDKSKEPKYATSLMSQTGSYDKYIQVVKETSQPNAQQRSTGDFYDFLLSENISQPSSIENNILKICEEN